MNAKSKKIIGLSALGAVAVVDIAQLQHASATPVTFNGSLVANPHGGSVQVVITVDAGRIIAISTPIQPAGGNASYSNRAVPVLTNEALAAQSAFINGVSGASEISNAWKASLSSAIAQAGSAIGVQAAPTPTPPAPVVTQSVTPTTPTTPTATTSGTAITPTSVASGCATMPPITNDLPEVTSPAMPSGQPTPSGVATPFGQPTPISSVRSDNRTTITLGQQYRQTVVQNNVTTVTKTRQITQIVTCTLTPAPAPTVTVTETALPISPGLSVVKKTFTCARTINGKTTKKIVKAAVIKCPLGYKLVKK